MDALSKIFDDIHLHRSEYIYLKSQQPWSFHFQDQDAMVAYVVIQGKGYLCLENEQVLLEAGDLCLVPSGQNHFCCSALSDSLIESVNITPFFQEKRHKTMILNAASTADSDELFMLAIRGHVDSIMAKPLFNALPKFLHTPHIMSSTAPEWLQIGLQFLAVEVNQIRPGRDKILDHLVSILFIECVRDYIAAMPDSNNWLHALSHPELSSALAAIHEQPHIAWTVETLAEQCCMSRSKFASLFTQMLGESPLAYLQQHRLRLATQFLQAGQLSIQQIAHRIGYSSETAFSQTFKKFYDLTPTQYRQQHQISKED
ncbi:AraC family transcriptional regulator [Acinetobacter sp. ANC 5054]|uniref:AraC family transcriptional regulator n=1 Tax=Acinetobacter sp. ANC 5054 TaxID=1977877 RepID=UPI000A348CAC|nr:AraC family transcriptional regulator [Acinetobacter sp. ANC 5054]OTG79521.1 AraC family transcriptional regulator [Acinetobacter sp. ANC 5054]